MKDSPKHSPELDLVGCLLSILFFFSQYIVLSETIYLYG